MPPCKETSKSCDGRFEDLKDRETGKEGIIFIVGDITWVSESEVEVKGGYYAGSMAASGNLFRVLRRDGRWVVEFDKRLWQA